MNRPDEPAPEPGIPERNIHLGAIGGIHIHIGLRAKGGRSGFEQPSAARKAGAGKIGIELSGKPIRYFRQGKLLVSRKALNAESGEGQASAELPESLPEPFGDVPPFEAVAQETWAEFLEEGEGFVCFEHPDERLVESSVAEAAEGVDFFDKEF